MGNRLVSYSVHHPKQILWGTLIFVLALAALIPQIKIDTDPENMLPADNAHRLKHSEIKKTFSLSDMIVVGVVNHDSPNGVFNPTSLAAMHALAKSIESIDGVVVQDLMSLSHVDNITQEGPGTIRFQWMMSEAPQTKEAAQEIQKAVARLPLLQNTLVSADGKAAGIYVPIVDKHESYRIASEIHGLIDSLDAVKASHDEYHITGLPVAEDTFGVEMFKQMAISAPLAGLAIFLLMWFFFRSLSLIVAPMLMAMGVVVATMGLLIGMGFTVHIMSSMIPIFLMPIAVVDSVHVLSEFADRYRPGDDAKALITDIMSHLFTPMLFTSVTSSVGFASLATTPIPPVQVFGLYIAFGIVLAFILTITFIPAYVAVLSEKRLAALVRQTKHDESHGPLAKTLHGIRDFSIKGAKPLILLFIGVFVFSVMGIERIQINDNPVRWFEKNHPIRVADKVLNEHFAGTYNAFLVLEQTDKHFWRNDLNQQLNTIFADAKNEGVELKFEWGKLVDQYPLELNSLSELTFAVEEKIFNADEASSPYWEAIGTALGKAETQSKYFQQPEALKYLEGMESYLNHEEMVGKSNSLADAVKTVYRELRGGDQQYYQLPDSSAGVAQTLLSFQSSHRPHDLWHMVTPDYSSTAIWLQLKSGDNQNMVRVVDVVDQYIKDHPLPDGVELNWGGLTYINVVWQEAMVQGMAKALIGSFIIVFVLMVFLFRSVVFGFLAMLPLSITITFIYGIIGWIGKDYDMPIAVLSALTLGLSVDFAIHFLERTRSLMRENGNWQKTITEMFEEPGRAISRNAIVIAIGFTPLLLAPLVPYQTVGLFLATIMAVSCLVTLVLLPASMHLIARWIFKKEMNNA